MGRRRPLPNARQGAPAARAVVLHSPPSVGAATARDGAEGTDRMSEPGATAGRGGSEGHATGSDASGVPLADNGDDRSASRSTLLKANATKSPLPATELLRSDAGDVAATTVTMERSGADVVTAQRVIMTNSGARAVEARSAQLDRSGVVSLRGEHAVLHGGSALAVAGDEVRLVKSRVLVVAARSAVVDEGARILVYAGPPGSAVRPAVDVAGAAAFGAGLGAALLLLGSLVRRLVRSL